MTNGFLLDTSVISLLAPGRPNLPPGFAKWLRERDHLIYLSVVTVLEIEQGIRKLQRAGGTERAARLADWLDRLLTAFSERLLALDVHVARLAGAMADAVIAKGRHPGLADVILAATARHHDLLLLTGNGRHFEPLGIEFADPLERLPE